MLTAGYFQSRYWPEDYWQDRYWPDYGEGSLPEDPGANTLLISLRNAVHDDSDTQTWCTANYSRNHKVYVGLDTREPPAEDQYPLVYIYPVVERAGYDLDSQDLVIGATCGIVDDDTRTVAGKTNAVELAGVQNIETFRKYVETAIVGAELGDLMISTVEIAYETIDFFPFFIATMEFTFTDDYAQGDDPFAYDD